VRFDLATLIKRARKTRRSQIVLRPIAPTAVQAGSLYAAAYRPVIEAWRVGVARIMAEYERSLPVRDALTTDSIFDLDSILAAIGDELARLVVTLTPALRDFAVRQEAWHASKFRGAVLTATSIDVGTLLGPEDTSETVQAFLANNTQLIRSVSDQTRTRVAEAVLTGYQNRTPAREVARSLDDAVELGRKRALRIAADQNTKLAARLDQARQEAAGIVKFRWRHSGKIHPRKEHVKHNGIVYSWDNLPLLNGEPDRPGQAPFCGCRAAAVIDLE
jgi:hypothetical protein